jgi:hypothetical protein
MLRGFSLVFYCIGIAAVLALPIRLIISIKKGENL